MQKHIIPRKHEIHVTLGTTEEGGVKTSDVIEYSIDYNDGQMGPKSHSLSILRLKVVDEGTGWVSRQFMVPNSDSGRIRIENIQRKNKRRQDALFAHLEQHVDAIHDMNMSQGVKAACLKAKDLLFTP